MSSAANPPVKLTSLVTNGRRDGQIRQSLAESKVQMAIETAKLAESEEKLAAAKAESTQVRPDHNGNFRAILMATWKLRQNVAELKRTGEILAEKLGKIDLLPTEDEEKPKDKVAEEDKSDLNLTGYLSETPKTTKWWKRGGFKRT